MDKQIGTIQTLEVLRKIETGYVLENDILLHHNETDSELEAEQSVDVFLYQDKKKDKRLQRHNYRLFKLIRTAGLKSLKSYHT